MKITPRNMVILTIVGVALVVLVLVAALVYPQVQKLSSLNAQLVDASAQVEAAKMRLEQQRAYKDRAVETNAKGLRLMAEVPDTPDLPALIIELQDTAFKSGVQVVAIAPSAPTDSDGYSTIPVALTVLGSWSDTVDYAESITRLERGLRLVNMNSVLTKDESEADKTNAPLPVYPVRTVIGVEAYSLPSTTTATPAP